MFSNFGTDGSIWVQSILMMDNTLILTINDIEGESDNDLAKLVKLNIPDCQTITISYHNVAHHEQTHHE